MQMTWLDNSEEGLQETTDLLCMYGAQGGLIITCKKTEAMVIGKATSQRPYTKEATVNMTVEDTPVQKVSDFAYLGTIISSDGTIDRELSARIQKASVAFNQLSYGKTATSSLIQRSGIIYAKINPVETYIGTNRLRWFGHVNRMPDTRLPKYLLNWTPAHGRRSRGRPRKNWMKCLLEDAAAFTGNSDIDLEGASEMASDRKLWREMIRHKREFIGAGHSND